MSSIDQQFVEFIVKSLVGKPDAVSIERRIDEKGVLLELTVDPEDLGRVIGKRGATAQSLRTLLRALGTKNDARYNLKIVDNGEPHERQPRPDRGEAESNPEPKPQEEDSSDSQADSTGPEQEAPAKTAEEAEDTSVDELIAAADDDHSDSISKTRKELAELDDLDV